MQRYIKIVLWILWPPTFCIIGYKFIIILILIIIIICPMTWCARRVTAQQSTWSALPTYLGWCRRGIHSWVASHGKINMSEPIWLNVKPQLMVANLKCCLGHGQIIVACLRGTVGDGFLGRTQSNDTLSSRHWLQESRLDSNPLKIWRRKDGGYIIKDGEYYRLYSFQ